MINISLRMEFNLNKKNGDFFGREIYSHLFNHQNEVMVTNTRNIIKIYFVKCRKN